MSSVGQQKNGTNSDVHPVMEQLGRKISLSDKSLRELETETGLSKSTLGRIVSKGDGSQTFSRICKLAAALGYDVRLVRVRE